MNGNILKQTYEKTKIKKVVRYAVLSFLFILFSGAFYTLHSQNYVGENIVQNPGFINDFEGWKKWGKNSSWVILSEGKNTPKSAHLSNSNSYFKAGLRQIFGKVTPGTYFFKVNTKMTGEVRWAVIELYLDNEWKRFPIPAGSEWHEMKIPDFKVSGDDNFAIEVFFQASAGAMFGFDDFSIELKSLSTSEDPENHDQPTNLFGRFHIEKDLLLINNDLFHDVDNIQHISGDGTILRDERLRDINFFATCGAMGRQTPENTDNIYLPVPHLMDLAFGDHWTDAYLDWDGSVNTVAKKVENTLRNGGKVWIADGGPSDFSAAVCRKVKLNYPDANLKNIHVVQHHPVNEMVATPSDWEYVKSQCTYHYIDEGNILGADNVIVNSHMDSAEETAAVWSKVKNDPKIKDIWTETKQQCDHYHTLDGTFHPRNRGKFIFNDTICLAWILGFTEPDNGTVKLYDYKSFFNEFGTLQY